MLHILFMILKIIGILILILLLLVLLIMAAVLLIPIRYQATAEKKENQGPAAQGSITWFLRFLSITVGYQKEAGFGFSLKVLGRRLFGNDRKPRERARDYLDDAPEPEEDATQSDAVTMDHSPTDEIPESGLSSAGEPIRDEDTINEEQTEAKDGGPEEAWEKKADTSFGKSFGKVLDAIRGWKEKISAVWEFLQRESTRETWRHLTRELGYLFRHYRPRKLEGALRFGMDDPAVTGEILGVLCVVSAFCGNTLQVEADFERPVLEGDLYLKGHIRICHAAGALIRLLLDRNIRKAIAKIRRMTQG